MKVDNSPQPIPKSNVSELRPRNAETTASATRTGEVSDLQLSELSSRLQTSAEAPPVDSARVAEIRQAIAEGRFKLNSGAIADRLIASARELVSKQART